MYNIKAPSKWGRGEIGRRNGLKIRWELIPCGFKSHRPHHLINYSRKRVFYFIQPRQFILPFYIFKHLRLELHQFLQSLISVVFSSYLYLFLYFIKTTNTSIYNFFQSCFKLHYTIGVVIILITPIVYDNYQVQSLAQPSSLKEYLFVLEHRPFLNMNPHVRLIVKTKKLKSYSY